MNFTIHYLAHSGWLLELEQQLVLIDYWKGVLPEIIHDESKQLLLLVSHGHYDHFNREAVFSLARARKNSHLVLSADIKPPTAEAISVSLLKEGDELSLGQLHLKAFGSTDAGISFMLNYPNLAIFHAGDYNLWHWPLESTEEEIKEAEQGFYRILDSLLTERVDVAFFPVDGRQKEDYDRGAREFCSKITPSYFLPMHFGEDVAVIEPFRTWAAEVLPRMRVLTPTPQRPRFGITIANTN